MNKIIHTLLSIITLATVAIVATIATAARAPSELGPIWPCLRYDETKI